ncbi:MAG: type II secretion system GspH family protein [Planctomycetaceae bacterium]|nr:type II secretion system GspH family protein [Planctomycetaceae bacterium]
MTRPRARTWRRIRAFTLLEAIVGVAIVAALLGALGIFIRNLGDARTRLATSVERIECADAVFALVDRALATAVVADPALGAGVGGNERSLRIVRATVGLGEGDAPLLAERERCEVRFDGGTGRIELARGDRRDAVEVPVRAMRVRYLVEGGWRDAFDSADAGVFPAGIEVSIWFDRVAEVDVGPVAGEAAAPAPLGSPDRRRFFRVPGAPRIDPLARRAIEDEQSTDAEMSDADVMDEGLTDESRDGMSLDTGNDGRRRTPSERDPASSRRGGGS